MPGLHAWYDASYPNGFGVAPPAADAAVAQWNDLSGNGRHLAQGTGANQPLYRVAGGPNGGASINFVDATDTMGVAVAVVPVRPITLIAVVKNTLADDAGYHKAFMFNAARIAVGLDWTTANAFTPFDDAAAQAGGTVAGDITTYHVCSFVARPVGGLSRQGVDGVHATTAGIAGTNTDSSLNVSNGSWIGHICEAMAFTGELSDPMIFALEQSLAEKWGVITTYQLAK